VWSSQSCPRPHRNKGAEMTEKTAQRLPRKRDHTEKRSNGAFEHGSSPLLCFSVLNRYLRYLRYLYMERKGTDMNRVRLFLLAIAIAGASLAAQQPPDRSHPPQAGPPPALNLPQIQKRQLANGLPVWIVELHKVPVAQVNLAVLSGTAQDPPGKFGIASLTSAMLEEGAGARSALELA